MSQPVPGPGPNSDATPAPLNEAVLGEAVGRLRAGRLVAFPTETVYGLGADALSAAAVRRVFEAKGRPATNPLIVHVAGPAMAERLVAAWPEGADRLVEHFWPGPLTIVAPKADAVPDSVTAGGPTVALRCPDHPAALALIERFGGPIVGPSANRSGGVSPTTARHVRTAFDPDTVLVLDGGPCRTGIESTVVRLDTDPAAVLRPGAIGAEELGRVLGRRVLGAGSPSQASARAGHGPGEGHGSAIAASPGLLDRHYAPATRCVLMGTAEIDEQIGPGVVVLARVWRPSEPGEAAARIVRLPSDDAGYAARLYAALREADESGASLLLIERPPTDTPLWQAIGDRLRRAAAE